MEEQYPLWLEGWQFSAAKINSEKPPGGGEARGWIRNNTELAHLRFHCRPRNRGKGGEVVKVYTIICFKNCFIRNENEFRKTPVGGWPPGWIRNIPESAQLSLHGRPRNRGKGAPQAAHTDTPCENIQQFPSAGISSELFLSTHPVHHQQTEKHKNCQSEQDVDQVLYSAMDGRLCENKQHGDTVPEKARDMFLFSLHINIKDCARCVSVMRATCVLLKIELLSTQL